MLNDTTEPPIEKARLALAYAAAYSREPAVQLKAREALEALRAHPSPDRVFCCKCADEIERANGGQSEIPVQKACGDNPDLPPAFVGELLAAQNETEEPTPYEFGSPATDQPDELSEENKRLKVFIHSIFVQCLNDFGDPYMGDDDESHVKTMQHCYDQINAFAQQVPDWGKWDYAGEAWQEGYAEGQKASSPMRESVELQAMRQAWGKRKEQLVALANLADAYEAGFTDGWRKSS